MCLNKASIEIIIQSVVNLIMEVEIFDDRIMSTVLDTPELHVDNNIRQKWIDWMFHFR